MNNPTKKAVILKNLSSPYIYQAIIILNETGALNESKALADAEKIVSDYILKHKKNEKEDIILYSRKKKSKKSFMNTKAFAFFSCSAIVGLILLLIFR